MEKLKSTADWFLRQTNANKIALVLLVVLSVMYVDRKDFKNELKTLKHERRKTDSTYSARLNRVTNDFQKKIDDCNNERIADYLRQSEMWQKKFDELFKETDVIYQQYQEAIKNR